MLEDLDGPNPFIDPAEWKAFIIDTKNKYYKMLEEEELGTDQV